MAEWRWGYSILLQRIKQLIPRTKPQYDHTEEDTEFIV